MRVGSGDGCGCVSQVVRGTSARLRLSSVSGCSCFLLAVPFLSLQHALVLALLPPLPPRHRRRRSGWESSPLPCPCGFLESPPKEMWKRLMFPAQFRRRSGSEGSTISQPAYHLREGLSSPCASLSDHQNTINSGTSDANLGRKSRKIRYAPGKQSNTSHECRNWTHVVPFGETDFALFALDTNPLVRLYQFTDAGAQLETGRVC